MTITRRITLLLLAAALALALAGCGDEDGEEGATPADQASAGSAAADGAGSVGADTQAITTAVGIAASIERCARTGDGYEDCDEDVTARTLADQAEATGMTVAYEVRDDAYDVAVTSQTGAEYALSGSADALQVTCTGGHDCTDGTFGATTGALETLRGERGESTFLPESGIEVEPSDGVPGVDDGDGAPTVDE